MKDFKYLVKKIEEVHTALQGQACSAVNKLLTIRNLCVGHYIVEFEQNGGNRAQYGSNLLSELAKTIIVKGLTAPELSRCRQFYNCYPLILGTVSQKSGLFNVSEIIGTLSQISLVTTSPEKHMAVPAELLLQKLSFSHFVELIKIDNNLKRTFYELECIKGTWSVRELKRQIASACFERSGLSDCPEKLSALIRQ